MDNILRILKILLHKFVNIQELELISLNRFSEIPMSAVNLVPHGSATDLMYQLRGFQTKALFSFLNVRRHKLVSHLLLFCIMRLAFPAVTRPHLITSSLRDVGPFHYNE